MDTQYKKSDDGKSVTITTTSVVDSATLKKQIQDQIGGLERLAATQAAQVNKSIADLKAKLAQIQ